MALIYKMRAIAQSDSSYVFWTDSEPDLDGSNAPEAVVQDSIVVDSVGGTGAAIPSARAPLTDPTLEIAMLLNENSGTSFANSGAAGGSDWTLTNGASPATVGATGIIDKSVEFSTSETSIIEAPLDVSLTGWDYSTLMAWVYPTGTIGSTEIGAILWKSEGSYPNATIGIGVTNGTGPYFRVNNTAYDDANYDIPLNTWTHIALSYDGSNANCYLNGMLVLSPAESGALTWTNATTNAWSIGAPEGRASDRAFKGRIEDARVYSEAKSTAFIQDVVARAFIDRG